LIVIDTVYLPSIIRKKGKEKKKYNTVDKGFYYWYILFSAANNNYTIIFGSFLKIVNVLHINESSLF
jgi:hypothetical protein